MHLCMRGFDKSGKRAAGEARKQALTYIGTWIDRKVGRNVVHWSSIDFSSVGRSGAFAHASGFLIT